MPPRFNIPTDAPQEPGSSVAFIVLGQPIPWARARGGSEFGGFYTPAAQRRFKDTIASYARVAMLERRMRLPMSPSCALNLRACVYLPVPVTWKAKRPAEYARAMAGGFCVERPDLDNWLKLPMDAMNGIVFVDDSQVVSFNGSGKWYDDAKPRLELSLQVLA